MKKRKPLSKKKNLTKEKKLEALHYKIFIGFCIANVLHYMFFEPQTFGSDSRYAIYVFWVPTFLGLVITSRYYIFNEIWNDLFKIKGESYFKMFYISIFILFCNCMFAYIVFGFSANAIWNYVNKNEAKNNQLETFYLPISEFSRTTGRGGANRVTFKFKGNRESIKTTYETIKPYLDKLPEDYQLILEVRKGIWNYYILEDFDLIKK